MTLNFRSSMKSVEDQQGIMEGEAFEAVRNSPLLASKAMIATGSSSIIFEGETENTIYRLSLDNAVQDISGIATKKGYAGIVQTIADYDAVAVYDEECQEGLWLTELERLESLENHPEQHETVNELLEYMCGQEALITDETVKVSILGKLATYPDVASINLTLKALKDLFPSWAEFYDFDFDITNFMVRPSTGDIVMSDPVHGGFLIDDARFNRLLIEKMIFEIQN